MSKLPSGRISDDAVFVVRVVDKKSREDKRVNYNYYYVCFVYSRKRGGAVKSIEFSNGKEVDLKKVKSVKLFDKPVNVDRVRRELTFDEDGIKFFTKEEDVINFLNGMVR